MKNNCKKILTNVVRLWQLCGHMKQKPLTEMIKTPVSQQLKSDLEKLAAKRELKIPDIVREALREYVAEKKVAAQIA